MPRLLPLIVVFCVTMGGCSVQEARTQVDAANDTLAKAEALYVETQRALEQTGSPEATRAAEAAGIALAAARSAATTATDTLTKIEAAQAAGGGVLDLVLAAAGALIPGAAGIALALQRIRKLKHAVASTAKYADKLEEGVTDSGLISEAKSALIATQSARGIHALVQGIRGK